MVSFKESASSKDNDDLQQLLDSEQKRLEQVEKRLGTEEEQSSDFDEAREIAHRLSNLKTLLNLRQTPVRKVSII